jgi:phosphoribosylformylglycinamidine synthase
MAFVLKEEGLEQVLEVFKKFEMAYAVVGRTDDSKVLKVYDGDNLVVNLPSTALSDAPPIEREEKRPKDLDKLLSQKTPKQTKTIKEIIYKLIASENICSKEWIYRQYDHEVGVRSVVKCGEGDSGVLRIIGTNKFVAASVGTNSNHCYLDPYHGAKGGLVEVCGNVLANGAKPMAMVNCCNFGNPEIPESFWFFSQSVKGMADFCKKLRIPVVGGNVSFYNEDEVTHTAIKATPIIMIVGLIEGRDKIITLPFKDIGNDIFLIGETFAELGGSEYHSVIYNLEGGVPPKVNEDTIKQRWEFLLKLYKNNFVKACHDVNKGGFIITVAEMCFKNNLGADLSLAEYNNNDLRDDELLFSESVGRFIIETDPQNYDNIIDLSKKYNIKVKKIGKIISNGKITIKGLNDEPIELDLTEMKNLYDSMLPDLMEI